MDEIDKLIDDLRKLQQAEGTVVSDSKQIGNAGDAMRLPLKDRISPTDEEAMARMRMEKAESGEAVDESGLSDEELQAADDAIVEKWADDIINKLLG